MYVRDKSTTYPMSAPPWTREQTAGGMLLALSTVSRILKRLQKEPNGTNFLFFFWLDILKINEIIVVFKCHIHYDYYQINSTEMDWFQPALHKTSAT